MVAKPRNGAQRVAVLLSAGLDSAVLLADAASKGPVVPVYVSSALAWEAAERNAMHGLLASRAYATNVDPLVSLKVEMLDVFPATHWAIRGEAPAFNTPDEDVYIEGRNITLLSKTAVFMARAGLRRVLLGSLAGNPFPDAKPEFFHAMSAALTLGVASPIEIEAPFARLHKSDVIQIGRALGVPFELTLSCMQPAGGVHCGRCSKCRERRDGFREAGVEDPTVYAER
jgi:7-cyano-7-deazaguanine synthase